MKRYIILFTLLSFATTTSFAAEPAGYEQQVVPFFKTYCLRCHDDKVQEGQFRLDTLSRDFSNQAVAQRWSELLFRMNSSEMPPKKETQPKAEELGKVAEWISTRIREGESVRMAKRGQVAHYRLSREEYRHTVYDLLGVHFDVNLPGVFNEDPRWHGYDRIGSMLSLSPSHVDRYFKAAETVIEQAFPAQELKSVKSRRDANTGHEKWLEEKKIAGPVRWQFWPGSRRYLINASLPGTYRIRIQLSGMQPLNGRAPHLSLWHQQTKRSVYDHDVIAAEGKPIVLDFEMALSPGTYELVNDLPGFNETGNHTLNVLNSGGNVFTNSRDVKHLNPTGYKLFDDDGQAIFPMLLVDWVEWEGPLTSDNDRKKREGMFPTTLDPKKVDIAETRDCLTRFAERAWRRPATVAEIERYVKVIESEIAAGENFRSAYRTAMIGILSSKNFYYLEEGSAKERRERINDSELASRLSYFFWSSLPDEELLSSAKAGKLHEPAILKTQLVRMLGDSKISRFTDSFPRQWLQLHRVGMLPPDPGLYPDYDKWLERSMILESTMYFDTVFRENLPIREFLSSDWTIANPRLAMHYGLPPLKESGFQKVKLRPDDHRGGVLTQASILSLTSDGTRHRPVHRGVWVSEAIFGRTPPPPPPNVEPLEPTPSNKPKATIRMQLEAHATHATCASCHRKIDPLGFAFDNFDAIGRWRTEEKVAGGRGANPPVDSTGKLLDGRTFHGPNEFKQLLMKDIDQFAEAFVEQLATYSLRRVMTIDDQAQIRKIASASKKDGYKLRTIVENLITSDLFLKR